MIRGRHEWGLALPRITALLTAVLAGMVAGELATAASVERYAVALVGAVVVGALVSAVRLWSSDSYDARLAIGGLATVVLVGQLLTSILGGPVGPDPGWDVAGAAVAVTAVVVLVLVAVVSFAPCQTQRRTHPYAL
ncbi:hypothetical protein [Nocardioides stalactiti]|uniref:hypothetical protein n=1 Tax=Nocardioides stalactiti TaxID=2755356 RepID=UPI001600D2A6|nr:hypothetical protein [Nocardioides stalactiti]